MHYFGDAKVQNISDNEIKYPVNTESDIANIVAATNNSQDKVLLVAGFYPNGRTQYIAIDLTNNR